MHEINLNDPVSYSKRQHLWCRFDVDEFFRGCLKLVPIVFDKLDHFSIAE
jgi:hypothetical protein